MLAAKPGARKPPVRLGIIPPIWAVRSSASPLPERASPSSHRIPACHAAAGHLLVSHPSNRFFTVDGGIGAKQRPFHGAMADDGDARSPHRIKFNLMAVGGLRTYLSFTPSAIPSIACSRESRHEKLSVPGGGIDRSLGRSSSESA